METSAAVGTYVGTVIAILLLFAVAATLVALIVRLVRGRQASFAATLRKPAVLIAAVAITGGYQAVVHLVLHR